MATTSSANNPLASDTVKKDSTATHERRDMEQQKERLAYDFKEMLSSAEALLRSTATYTGAEIEEARSRLHQQLEAAREKSGEMTESVRDAGQRVAASADECVRKHPWTCIGAAFVLGMGVAQCMRR